MKMSQDVHTINASDYDRQNAKLRSSVTWIIQVASRSPSTQHSFITTKKRIFDECGTLTDEAKSFLISGWVYKQICNQCFVSSPTGNVYENVIGLLCRHGFYLLENDEPVMTPQQFQDKSFNVEAHLGLIDKLMWTMCSVLWSPVERVVQAVKVFAPFSASKDLPNNAQEAIVLWLNKVVFYSHSESYNSSLVVETRFQQLEEIKVPSMNAQIPMVSFKLDDICDSCILAMLLHYYCPDHIQRNDIVMKEEMSIGDALHNLNTALTFCYNKVFPQHQIVRFRKYLTAEDFLQCPEELRYNFVTFYSLLFYCFECEPVKGIVNPKGHSVEHTRESLGEQQLTARSDTRSQHPSEDERETSSRLATVLPDVKSLISETTKKSFHPQTPEARQSNLKITNSQSDSDLSTNSALFGIPQRPLLPKRNQEERPHSRHIATGFRNGSEGMQKSASLHNVSNGLDTDGPADMMSKWQRNVITKPYSARSNASTISSVRSQPSSPARKFWEHANVASTGLLSKVDVSSDSEIEEIFSARDSVDQPASSSQTSTLAWSNFTTTYDPSTSSTLTTPRTNNVGDLTLETVRTLDYQTPPSSGREDTISSQSVNPDSSSELTDVTTILASGDSQLSRSARLASAQQAMAYSSQKSPSKSISVGQSDAAMNNTRSVSQASYVVSSGAFNTADSARAAGYPVINDRDDISRSPVKQHAPAPEVAMETEGSAPDVRLLDIINRMRNMAEHIKRQKLELEQQRRDVMAEKYQHHMVQLKDFMQHVNKQEARKKEESSSDYSSKSPSPATSARIENVASNGIAAAPTPVPLRTTNFTLSPHRPATPRDAADEVTMVQQTLNQLQLSVERERQKRKANDLERSINGLQAELKNLEKSSIALSPARNPIRCDDSSGDGADKVVAPSSGEAPAVMGNGDGSTAPRRSLFPSATVNDRPASNANVVNDMQYPLLPSTEQTSQNDTTVADTTRVPHEISVSYDSFSCQLKSSSCQSTPAKSPLVGSPENHTTLDTETTLVQQNEVDKKGALGFEIVDEKSPATKLAKKKEQFLLGRLKKEEEQRMKQMEREMESEKRKRENREQQEKLMQKKQDEKEKRDRRLKEYQKRKEQEELAAHAIQKPGIISNTPVSGGKKVHKPKSNIVEQVEVLENIANIDLPPSSSSAIGKNQTYHLKTHVDDETESTGSGSSDYTGPKLFKQLISKSNRALINNALNHCCLSGKVNETVRQKTLRALDNSNARHLMVLFRDSKCQYRAIYSYNPDEEKLHKITGNGPSLIVPSMIESLFKYNSGRRTFNCVPSKTLSVSIDAITIKSSLWHHTKK